jgi:hypothetical protein
MADIAEEPLAELDRRAVARHYAQMGAHCTALARLFDPAVKLGLAKKGLAGKRAAPESAADKAARPKRQPTQYNKFMSEHMPAFKEEARAFKFKPWDALRRAAPRALRRCVRARCATAIRSRARGGARASEAAARNAARERLGHKGFACGALSRVRALTRSAPCGRSTRTCRRRTASARSRRRRVPSRAGLAVACECDSPARARR